MGLYGKIGYQAEECITVLARQVGPPTLHGAERTTTAGSAKPWNAYALAYGEACCLRTLSNYLSHDLMPRHQFGPTWRQVTVDDVQIGAAHAAGKHAHYHLVVHGL